MKLYLAGLYTSNFDLHGRLFARLTEAEKKHRLEVRYLLESYHYIHRQSYVDKLRRDGVKVFLDSGAFSAFTKGVEIDIPGYCQYIRDNEDIVEKSDGILCASVLDGIGDPLKTWQNQLYMESLGVQPLPCFHYGEDERYLEWYISKYEYITLGGMVPISTPQLKVWLDHLWDKYLTDGSGRPRLKVHGFGLTTLSLMERYPWHCMTEEDHQVLSRTGWKSLADLIVGEEILCFDKGNMQWEPILDLPIFTVVDAPISVLENRNFHAKVTANHRWLVHNAYGNWGWKVTEDLGSQQHQIPRVGDGYTAPTTPFYKDAFVDIMAWYWTEGHIKRRKPKYKKDSITISQSQTANPEKVSMIREALQTLGEKFCEHTAKRWPSSVRSKYSEEVTFEIYGEARDALLELSPDKHIPLSFILKLTGPQLKRFVDLSILADGSKWQMKRGANFTMAQKDPASIDNFRIACLLAGIPTSRWNRNKHGTTGVAASSVHQVYADQLKIREEKYTGRLWCVTVPSSAFFTKSKEKIYVTGNSVDSSSWVQIAANGSILVPGLGVIAVSTSSPSAKQEGRHVLTLPSAQQEALSRRIESYGFEVARLTAEYVSRWTFNCAAFREINDSCAKVGLTFVPEQMTFF